MIIHTLTDEFIVDGIGEIRNPLGMVGNRLEVNSLIIDAFRPSVNSLLGVVGVAGGKAGGIIYSPLAAAKSVLTKAQRGLGVVLIDLGFGTTGMAVYEEDKLLTANVFPVGAGNITNDLAIGLKCSIETAELVKLSFGSALARGVSSKEKIELGEIDDKLKSEVSRRFISEIIEVRLAETFEFINNELKIIKKQTQLPAGAVLVGGGVKMPDILELAKQELKLPVQLGIPSLGRLELADREIGIKIEDPEFAVATGLLFWAVDQSLKDQGWSLSKGNRMLSFFKNFLP